MTNRLLLLSAAALLSTVLCAQDDQNEPATFGAHYTQIGVDLGPAISAGLGNGLPHTHVEIHYREHSPKRDLRFKLQFSNQSYLPQVFQAFRQPLPEINPGELRFLNNDISTRLSTLLTAGASVYRSSNGFPFYLGGDLSAGLSFVERSTFISYGVPGTLGNLDAQTLSRKRHQLFVAEIVPFIGTNLKITDRLQLSLEFGLPLIFSRGEVTRMDDEQNVRVFQTSYTNLLEDRIINDIAILYRL